MNFDLLKNFFNNAYFNQGSITITSKEFYYDNGHRKSNILETATLNIRKVLAPVNVKDLVDMGLGEYSANDTFDLYVDQPLKYPSGALMQNGDLITYQTINYKLISSINVNTHGFYRYLITKFKDGELND